MGVSSNSMFEGLLICNGGNYWSDGVILTVEGRGISLLLLSVKFCAGPVQWI